MAADGRRGVGGFTLLELMVVVVLMSISVVAALAIAKGRRDIGTGTKCMSRLCQIGQGVALYSHANNEYLPYADGPCSTDSLALLYSEYMAATQIFACPKSQDRPRITMDRDARNAATGKRFGRKSPDWTSYGYDNHASIRNMEAGRPVVADMDGSSAGNPKSKTANHVGGQNVLFFDGHVEWMTSNTWLNGGSSDNYYAADCGGGDSDAWVRRP